MWIMALGFRRPVMQFAVDNLQKMFKSTWQAWKDANWQMDHNFDNLIAKIDANAKGV